MKRGRADDRGIFDVDRAKRDDKTKGKPSPLPWVHLVFLPRFTNERINQNNEIK